MFVTNDVMSCTSAVPADSGFSGDGDVIVAHLMNHLLNETSLTNQTSHSELSTPIDKMHLSLD